MVGLSLYKKNHFMRMHAIAPLQIIMQTREEEQCTYLSQAYTRMLRTAHFQKTDRKLAEEPCASAISPNISILGAPHSRGRMV